MAPITEDVTIGRIVGAPVARKEDVTLLTGQAVYVDDMSLPGMVWMSVVRSPYAHARISSVDVSGALAHRDVIAAFSGEDLAGEWQASLPCAWLPTEDAKQPNHRPLTIDEARYVGDGVAVVVGESREAARDAAELVQVDYEPLPAVVDPEAALADGAPLVHEEFGTNRCYTWSLSAGEVDEEFARADVTVKERYRQQRLIPNAMEPRGVIVQPVPATGELTMWSSTQIPHIARVTLSMVMGIPETKLRVIAPEVGGGFGSKLNVYAEEALCAHLAMRLNAPVKWTETRRENAAATIHGRDQIGDYEVAVSKDGSILGIKARTVADLGAYNQLLTPAIPTLTGLMLTGCYRIPAVKIDIVGVYTNKMSTDAYRGAGRPEATYLIERLMDVVARELNIDRIDLRLKHFPAPTEFPFKQSCGLTYDSGNYQAAL